MKLLALILASVFLFGCLGAPSKPTPSPTIMASAIPTIGPSPSKALASSIISSPSAIPGGSKFLPYDKAQYEDALMAGKVVLLFFQSSACTDCEKERLAIEEAFKTMALANVGGFRVNFLAPDANGDEEAITEVFNVTSSGTILILGEGASVKYKDSRSLLSQEIVSELRKAGAG